MAMKRFFASIFILFLILGCVTTPKKSDSYLISEQYFLDVREDEDPWVMESFFNTTESLSEKEYGEVIEYATKGIDDIPKYMDLFAFFYAARGYSYIMQYKLDKGLEDIKNLENLDKDSYMIPFLYTYYYISYSPFDSDPKGILMKALASLNEWKEKRPKNYFETFFSNPTRISEIEKVIQEGINK